MTDQERQTLIEAWQKMEDMSEEPERTHIHKVIEKLKIAKPNEKEEFLYPESKHCVAHH